MTRDEHYSQIIDDSQEDGVQATDDMIEERYQEERREQERERERQQSDE